MGNSLGHNDYDYTAQSVYDRIMSLVQGNNLSENQTQKVIGGIVNVTQPTVSKWKKRLPGIDILVCIAQKFNVSLDWLLFGKGEKEGQEIPQSRKHASTIEHCFPLLFDFFKIFDFEMENPGARNISIRPQEICFISDINGLNITPTAYSETCCSYGETPTQPISIHIVDRRASIISGVITDYGFETRCIRSKNLPKGFNDSSSYFEKDYSRLDENIRERFNLTTLYKIRNDDSFKLASLEIPFISIVKEMIASGKLSKLIKAITSHASLNDSKLYKYNLPYGDLKESYGYDDEYIHVDFCYVKFNNTDKG